MKLPKSFTKKHLLAAVDVLNAEKIVNPALRVKSKSTQVIIDSLSGVLAGVDQEVLKGCDTATLEVLEAFAITDKFVKDPSDTLLTAKDKRSADTYGPADPEATLVYKKLSKKEKKAAKKAAKEAAEQAAKDAENEGKKKKGKKKGPKGPGVIVSIAEILLAAKKPLTVEQVADALSQKFPDKERETMLKTAKAQLGKAPTRLEREKGHKVKVEGDKPSTRTYFIKKK